MHLLPTAVFHLRLVLYQMHVYVFMAISRVIVVGIRIHADTRGLGTQRLMVFSLNGQTAKCWMISPQIRDFFPPSAPKLKFGELECHASPFPLQNGRVRRGIKAAYKDKTREATLAHRVPPFSIPWHVLSWWPWLLLDDEPRILSSLESGIPFSYIVVVNLDTSLKAEIFETLIWSCRSRFVGLVDQLGGTVGLSWNSRGQSDGIFQDRINYHLDGWRQVLSWKSLWWWSFLVWSNGAGRRECLPRYLPR